MQKLIALSEDSMVQLQIKFWYATWWCLRASVTHDLSYSTHIQNAIINLLYKLVMI